MHAHGILDKMSTSFINPVQYFLKLGDDQVAMNLLIGTKIKLQWSGKIFCTVCGKKTSKSFGEGMHFVFCYNNNKKPPKPFEKF